MAPRRKRIGEILVEWKIINQKALDEALAYAATNRKRIGVALIELELCTEEDVTKALAAQFAMP
jgi:type IV pilus assembly protein PilB